MTTAIKNVSPISAIIAGVMKDATTEGNRQAELTVAMFKNEVTYSSENILDVFRKEGAEKTEAIDVLISDASDEYAGVMDHMASIKDKPSKERSTADVFQIDSLNRKARAARMMFERALKSVYWLRASNVSAVSLNKIGTGAMRVVGPSAALDPSNKDDDDATADIPVKVTFSCNTLANKGNDAIRVKLGKSAAKTATAKNPAANVIADASKSLAAVLSNLGNDGKRKPITDFSDAVEADLETTLRELFAMKFVDERGRVDLKEVTAWADEQFNIPASKAKQETKAA